MDANHNTNMELKRFKKGTVDDTTGKMLWCYLRNKAYWVTPEHFLKMRIAQKEAYQSNRPYRIRQAQTWTFLNCEQAKNNKKKWTQDNKEIVKDTQRKWRQSNPDYHTTYKRERRKNDPYFRLVCNLRGRIRNVLSSGRKSFTAEKLLGAPFEFVHEYLTKLLLPGMTWKNYGYYTWHVDHIIPINSFDLTDQEQQCKCFHYSNLQPLWAHDNLVKKAKISRIK